MRIKVFKAADLKEAMAMVKDELGSDAVILHTKRYKEGGFLGYNGKEIVEVTAAVDDTPRRPRVRLPAMPKAKPEPKASPSPPEKKAAPTPAVQAHPKSVLTQYKTAGTEAGVNLAKLAEQTAPIDKAPPKETEFLPMAPETISRDSLTPVDEVLIPESIVDPTPQPRIIAVTPSKLRTKRRRTKPEQSVAEPEARVKIKASEAGEDEPEPAASPRAPRQKETKSAGRVKKAATSKTAKASKPAPQDAEGKDKKQLAGDASREQEAPKAPESPPEKSTVEPRHQEKIKELEDELAQMRQMLRQVMSQSERGEITTLKDLLKAHELRDDVMQDIIRKIPPATLMLSKDDPEAAKGLSEYLHSVLKTGDGIGLRDGRPKIVALIGTTGVGKTTTIAKIAAKFVLERGVSVALVTADTYRISAVDQLKTYSDIIGLPLEIVYSPAELAPALKKHKNKKLILIDTAGRSQNNEYQMNELREFLAVDPSIEKHLVLSATTKERDAEAILARFADCRPDRLLFTKTDETESIGAIVNLLFDKRIALSYITTGQSVPDDIEPAKPEALARLLLR